MTWQALARRLALGVAATAALGLSSCATSTPYQPIGAGQVAGGYSEIRLAPDRYRVTFSGNTLTSRDTVEGYLLYRAAELTLQQGCDWFVIDDRRLEHDVRTHVTPDTFYHPWYGPAYLYWTPSWRYRRPHLGWSVWSPYRGDPFWASHVDVRTVERFEASAEISLRHGAKPADDPKTFDARQVIEALGPKIQRPES